MKKSILMAVAICFISISYAQSVKYMDAMKANIAMMDSSKGNDDGAQIINTFIRIGDAEKTQWLPYYYAAYATIGQAFSEQDVTKKDAIADKANEYITKAAIIAGKDNSEIELIKSMIATVHMTVDPQSRFMTYGSDASASIEKAEKLDPTNPRPVFLDAQTKFYTPEAFGGGKDVAKELLDKAAKLFDAFKPETSISPVWGRKQLDKFLEQYK